ncbi:MAG: patatin-like phospholipase family protein [Akkermansiaceae bacterium]
MPLSQSSPSSSKNGAEPSRIAVSLQSSFLGFFAHAGFINALTASGIYPQKISGSSAGALVAAAYASGLQGNALRDYILNPKLQGSFREWSAILRIPLVMAFYHGHGFVTGKKATRYLRETLPVGMIEDTPLAELSISVSNLTEQRGEIVHQGEIAPYVVASCAAAPVIRSQEIDGQHFIDGGFTDESPFEQWLDDPDIDTIIIHRIGDADEQPSSLGLRSNYISCYAAMHHVTADKMLEYRLEAAAARNKKIIIHETKAHRTGLLPSSELTQKNYDAAFSQWADSEAEKRIQPNTL